jgi:hypothetical protein
MTYAVSPWDALIRRPIVRRQPAQSPTPDAKPPTKTAQLLQMIEDNGRVNTLTLCLEMDMPSMSVWGLLKIPRQTGQVRFDGTHWMMGTDYVPQKLQKAAQLLRQAGWTVVEPAGSAK